MKTEFDIIKSRKNRDSIIRLLDVIYIIPDYFFNLEDDYFLEFAIVGESKLKKIKITDLSTESQGYTKTSIRSYEIIDELRIMKLISENSI